MAGAIGICAAMAGLSIAGASGPAGAATGPAVRVLPGSTVPFTSRATATGNVPGSTRISVQVWLKPKTAAATSFAKAVSTPRSAQFHHYLRPAAYTARFGASRATAARVESWLRAKGFTAVRTDPGRSYVRATAAVSKLNRAFGVTMKLYRRSARANAGRYTLRANDRAVSVPASLAAGVLGVTGLDNAAPANPLLRPSSKRPGTAKAPRAKVKPTRCSSYYGQRLAKGLPPRFGRTTFPTDICGYSAGQLRAAYGASPAATGRGQTVALVEIGLTRQMFRTLTDYAKVSGLQAPSRQRYSELSIGQGTACGDFFDVEEQLDVESSYDMAPGASQLVVGGDSCNNGDFGLQALFDADTAILNGRNNHPLASVASNSWEGGDESQPAFVTNIEHAYLVRAAAEGVGMYFSSGDASGVESPSSDPFAIGVGGTTLGIGKTHNRLFETGWSTGQAFLEGGRWVFEGEQGAAGGGPSLLWQQPAFQAGVVPTALATAPGDRGGLVRSAPDISADADPFTGMGVGLLHFPKNKHKPVTFGLTDVGGTSLSSPLVAGIVAAAQQGQSAPFGYIDPAIYKLAGTGAYHDVLPITGSTSSLFRAMACDKHDCGQQTLVNFDDESQSMLGYSGQVTLPGYDSMSGLGTPNGQAFITALRGLEG
jgi:subtilase family serine protease